MQYWQYIGLLEQFKDIFYLYHSIKIVIRCQKEKQDLQPGC